MPVIACPGCGKKYKLPTSAAGQVAKCGCGKRFRLGPAPAASAAAARPKRKSAASSPPARPKPRSTDPVAAVAASDAFWDDVLGEESSAKPITPPTPSEVPVSSGQSPAAKSVAQPAEAPAKSKPKKRKKKKIRWGFQWEKVGAGAAMLLIGGGITIGLVISTGYLFYWPAGIAVVGLFTMLSGLMGEEGIW